MCIRKSGTKTEQTEKRTDPWGKTGVEGRERGNVKKYIYKTESHRREVKIKQVRGEKITLKWNEE